MSQILQLKVLLVERLADRSLHHIILSIRQIISLLLTRCPVPDNSAVEYADNGENHEERTMFTILHIFLKGYELIFASYKLLLFIPDLFSLNSI